MSSVLEQLLPLLSRFDDEAYAGLANRGLVRRARKDLQERAVTILEQSATEVLVGFGAHRIRLDARGPAHARCDCPASNICQHILAAAMGLQQTQPAATAENAATAETDTPAADALAGLQAILLAMSATQLSRHAGKAGYRWAWQYVQDRESALVIEGTQHLVLRLQQPRLTLRFMGGSIDSLVADTNLPQIEKYRVAAVLAFQQAHGQAITPPPEPATRSRHQALDLGQDHALAATRADSLDASRERLRMALRRILAESVELGLAHLSRGIHERYVTLAVWAQGAEYYRLALLLRRIADHVELLLERASGADELRLLDEMTLTHGLACALDAAAARGETPRHLVGRARSRFEDSGALELVGLGAQAWRSASGYTGLTMMFWCPPSQTFMACTDARPETQRAFNPLARYKAAGPWAGLGAPEQATGRCLVLQGAQLNDSGRLSAANSTSATVQPAAGTEWLQHLQPRDAWAELHQARRDQGRSLLAEPEPMQDWVMLKPAHFGKARFDETRQTLVWPLHDATGDTLFAELPFDEYNRHAILRIEGMPPRANTAGNLLVARLHASVRGEVVAAPLSVVHADSGHVDALHFDTAPETGVASALLQRIRQMLPAQDTSDSTRTMPETLRPLRELHHELQRHAERGIAPETSPQVLAALARLGDRLGEAGVTTFQAILSRKCSPGECLLRMNYVHMQHRRLLEA